jgi:mannitol 2-dehydrogenase
LFGATGADARLQQPVGRWLASLYANGTRQTLAEASRVLGF